MKKKIFLFKSIAESVLNGPKPIQCDNEMIIDRKVY